MILSDDRTLQGCADELTEVGNGGNTNENETASGVWPITGGSTEWRHLVFRPGLL